MGTETLQNLPKCRKRGKRGGKKALVGFFPSGFRENPLQGSQNNHNFADVNKQQSEY
jgi:hypothetical protein